MTGSKKKKQVVINKEVSEVLPQNSTSRVIDKTEKTENLILQQSLNETPQPD